MTTATTDPDHYVDGTPFFVRPKGARFAIFERGTGPRGMARLRATHRTLKGALELAAFLTPSTPAEILDGIPVYSDLDRALYRKLVALGEPGAPLFVLSQGQGYKAVSEGLAVNAAEALFGPYGLDCWLISWRDPSGELVRGMYANPVEDAERAWWILRDGKVVAGGPRIYDQDRAAELAAELGGVAVHGTGWADR